MTTLLLSALLAISAANPVFQIKAGQSVYIVAMDSTSRDNNLTSGSLELERKAREQFEKLKKFKVAGTLAASDFVFVSVIDRDSEDMDEIALAVPTSLYAANKGTLDKLRDVAVWQASAHVTRKDRASAMIPGVAMYRGFSKPSLVKDLVKQFHKETLRKL